MTAVYFFAGILGILLAAVLLAPLLEGSRDERAEGDAERRLADALEALREIEFEHETGKLSDEDYRVLRAEHAHEAIAARDAGAGASSSDAAARDTRRPEVDAASQVAHPAERCRICEAPLRSGARFCSRCGTAVAETA